MANKGPVLGVVACTASGCKGEMLVRSRKAGRGGGTKKYGHCQTCGALEQKNAFQEHLNSYRKSGSEPDSLPVPVTEAPVDVVKEPSFKVDAGGFDTAEITHLPGSEPDEIPVKETRKTKRGGLLKVVGVCTAVVLAVMGAGYVATR